MIFLNIVFFNLTMIKIHDYYNRLSIILFILICKSRKPEVKYIYIRTGIYIRMSKQIFIGHGRGYVGQSKIKTVPSRTPHEKSRPHPTPCSALQQKKLPHSGLIRLETTGRLEFCHPYRVKIRRHIFYIN